MSDVVGDAGKISYLKRTRVTVWRGNLVYRICFGNGVREALRHALQLLWSQFRIDGIGLNVRSAF